jgi:hypothetical protein
MATMTPTQREQGADIVFPIENGEAIQDFEEYTFQAPRPGFFLGDSLAPDGGDNPVLQFEQRNSKDQIPSGKPSRPFLDKLDNLPTELLFQICTCIDICSLISFRRVNHHALHVIDSFPPFRSISTFPKLLGAVEALQCRSWTIQTMMHCILDDRCSVCGHYGDLLYLVTPERWCYKCWLSCDNLVVQRFKPPMMSEQEGFGACQQIPNIRLSVGYYGLKGTAPACKEMICFDQRALRQALPAACDWHNRDVRKGHPLRYATVIRAPYWDAQTAHYEEGFFCRACTSQGWLHRDRTSLNPHFFREDYPIWELPWRRYTRSGMKAHIQQCGRILKVQDRQSGMRYVHEKPFTRTRYTWDEPDELRGMTRILRRCKDKELQFPFGQPYLSSWEHVYVDVELRGEVIILSELHTDYNKLEG